jgi:LysM repeat protein
MKHLLKYIFLCLSILFFANYQVFAGNHPVDTLKQKRINGIRVKLYKVQAKDTWTSISKKNKVSVAFLMTVNGGIDGLKTGQIINIPAEEGSTAPAATPQTSGFTLTTPEQTKDSKYLETVYHTIKKGETLFRISKQYDQTVENIKSWNNIKSNDLKIGQKLIVNHVYKYRKVPLIKENETAAKAEIPVKAAPVENEITKHPAVVNAIEENSKPEQAQEHISVPVEKNITANSIDKNISTTSALSKSPNGRIIKQINETGVAAWIMDGELNQNKYYALHRNAPVGTIVKVTNRMNGKYVFVKVVGLLPNTGDNDNLIIKISQAASNKINVLDSKFQAELSYGIPE